MLDLNKIKQYPLPAEQYYAESNVKKQIYLHHTAGGPNPYAVIDGWNADAIRIGTSMLIAGKPSKNSKFVDGEMIQAFPSKNWAYHLGLKQEVFTKYHILYQPLDRFSIGIEVCNWGQLTKTERGWETYVGTTVADNEVVEYPMPVRGFFHYHKYTNAQIDSLKDLIVYFGEKYEIPVKYIGDSIFDINLDALRGDAGVFTHVSVRSDKNDMHPQPELIEMLKSL